MRGSVLRVNASDVKDIGGRETKFPSGKDPVRIVPEDNDFDGRVP
jgi:hypothetical protein